MMKKSKEENYQSKTGMKPENIEGKKASTESAATTSTRAERIRRRAEESRKVALNKAVAQLP